MEHKYIFVVGGVMSGVGKGIAASSIGKILQAKGLRVSAMKIDPYVNVDAGTMNPTEHGEVFVLEDGTECDQDMGNYERFLDMNFDKRNYMTTGSIYSRVIEKERNLEYEGKCVSVVPHIPLEVISRIDEAAEKDGAEVVIVEIGGTVGEYENILFLEAIRVLRNENPEDVALVLVSFLPFLKHVGELKTKPTQHAVRNLQYVGLQPDVVIARAKRPIDKKRKQKIAFNCSMAEEDVISAPDVSNIYEVPINFERDNLSGSLIEKLSLSEKSESDMKGWESMVDAMNNSTDQVRIGIVGKYFETGAYTLADSYISVIEAIKHAGAYLDVKPKIEWINTSDLEGGDLKTLDGYDGIIVPGGFGSRGTEEKISAIGYCRQNNIPFFGLCYGMQLALVEFARKVCGLEGANSTEIDEDTPHPVIDYMPEQVEVLESEGYGATMRLGAQVARLEKGTVAAEAYGKEEVRERHRHRYEVNPEYVEKLEEGGAVFSAYSPDKGLKEVFELSKEEHPFFLGTQYHPEFGSRPLKPHPLFVEFLKIASKE